MRRSLTVGWSRLNANSRAIVARNRARRLARQHGLRRARWIEVFYVGFVVTLILAVVLDPATGAYRHSGELRALARRLTGWGRSDWILVPTALMIVAGLWLGGIARTRRLTLLLHNWMCAASFVFLSVGGAGGLAAILKRIIGRGRPEVFREFGAYSFHPFAIDADWASFPSGHATVVGALAACFFLLYRPAWPVILPLALAIGCTRLVVGAHYPSDVAAGLIFGAWFAYFVAIGFQNRGLLFRHGLEVLPVIRRSFGLLSSRTLRRMRATSGRKSVLVGPGSFERNEGQKS